ncbi:hypothetical protein BYT27DRAFT_6436035 [Phlegmacium glaucopus]|nr:hypothetical protein BYT27DRAFT_6436035 [Phlegmacium glaucopus]
MYPCKNPLQRREWRTLDANNHINEVKYLQSCPAFEPHSMSGIQTRFNNFQASHIQLADRDISLHNSYPGTDISYTSTKRRFELSAGTKRPLHIPQCGYPLQDKGDYHRFNIAYVEYEKDLNDNVFKILWSLFDECRLSTYICFWCHHREH